MKRVIVNAAERFVPKNSPGVRSLLRKTFFFLMKLTSASRFTVKDKWKDNKQHDVISSAHYLPSAHEAAVWDFSVIINTTNMVQSDVLVSNRSNRFVGTNGKSVAQAIFFFRANSKRHIQPQFCAKDLHHHLQSQELDVFFPHSEHDWDALALVKHSWRKFKRSSYI